MMSPGNRLLNSLGCALALLIILAAGACAPARNVPSPTVHRTAPPVLGGTGFVTTSALNLRQCPSTQCSILAVLNRGDAVSILENKSGWSKVKAQAGQREGWVASRYLSREAGQAPTPAGKGAEEPPPLPKEQWSSPSGSTAKPPAPKEEFAR